MTNEKLPKGNSNVSRASFKSIRITTIIIIGISLLIGYIGGNLIRNSLESEIITFSTPSLIALLFGVGLSLASIVLAITAISLGRSSEQVVVERSDESIRLQSEIFTKTTEALARIESSTGVIAARVEDMAGRASIVSDRVAEKLIGVSGISPRQRDEIEKEVRESIISEMSSPPPPLTRQEARTLLVKEEKSKIQTERFKNFHETVLIAISNIEDVTAIKIGDGIIGTSGHDLVDGVFRSDGDDIAVCVQDEHYDWLQNDRSSLLQAIRGLAVEIANDVFAEAFVAFDRNVDDEPEYQAVFEDIKKITKEELVHKITIVSGSADHVVSEIAIKLMAKNK